MTWSNSMVGLVYVILLDEYLCETCYSIALAEKEEDGSDLDS